VITVEDNSIIGGFGSGVCEFAEQYGYKNDILIHGLPDKFIEHGNPEELHAELRLNPDGLALIAEEFLTREKLSK
ncbi:MAG: 1-deoxy-D-xylulose-5-phosphate synthase, partial [Ignavibacteria bacterium]|nr:1-deoxy-D-xylulose-5-phosphate synthase [Ignavibacteria bacterium]